MLAAKKVLMQANEWKEQLQLRKQESKQEDV